VAAGTWTAPLGAAHCGCLLGKAPTPTGLWGKGERLPVGPALPKHSFGSSRGLGLKASPVA
jgi:hypothetical protein